MNEQGIYFEEIEDSSVGYEETEESSPFKGKTLTYSEHLTLNYYLRDNNRDQDVTSNGALEAHLRQFDYKNFCKCVFVIGQELRDELDIPSDSLRRALSLIEEVFAEHRDEIYADRVSFVQYKVGMANILLENCPREEEDITSEIIHSSELDFIISNIRKALQCLEEAQPLATGVLSYHVHRTYDYIFQCIYALSIDNDDVPIDLDSVYVFTDMDNTGEIWNELVKQLRAKVIRGEPRVVKVNNTDVALRELDRMVKEMEKAVEEQRES